MYTSIPRGAEAPQSIIESSDNTKPKQVDRGRLSLGKRLKQTPQLQRFDKQQSIIVSGATSYRQSLLQRQ